ncbi:hypothetical protein D3C75_467400 [compost metagenome]
MQGILPRSPLALNTNGVPALTLKARFAAPPGSSTIVVEGYIEYHGWIYTSSTDTPALRKPLEMLHKPTRVEQPYPAVFEWVPLRYNHPEHGTIRRLSIPAVREASVCRAYRLP